MRRGGERDMYCFKCLKDIDEKDTTAHHGNIGVVQVDYCDSCWRGTTEKIKNLGFGIHLKFDGSGYSPIDSRISTTGKEIDPNGINHPSHYNKHPSGVECIDIIRHHSHNVGAAIKYLWRAGLKENESNLKDLKKALWYLQDEIAREEKRNAPKND